MAVANHVVAQHALGLQLFVLGGIVQAKTFGRVPAAEMDGAGGRGDERRQRARQRTGVPRA